MKLRSILIIIFLSCFANLSAEIIPGQAVSWSDFSHITCITTSGELAYFGTTEGILRYHRFDDHWLDPITVSDGLQGKQILRIAVPFDDSRITVETEQGIYVYETGIDQWFLDTEFPAEDSQDSRPRFPMPPLFMPFGYTLEDEGYISDRNFNDWQITATLDDGYSTFFIGTWGLGILKADQYDLQAQIIPYGLLQKRTDAIYIEGDSIWLAGNAGDLPPEYPNQRMGVTLYDRSDQRFSYFEPRYFPGFDSEIIYDIAGDRQNLYFAGRLGLSILPRDKDYFITLTRRDGLPVSEATALAISPDSVWIGTPEGLALYTPSVDTMAVVGRRILGQKFITALHLSGDKLIIGTTEGTFYIDTRLKKIGSMKDPEGILGGSIREITSFYNEIFIASDWGLVAVDLKTGKASSIEYLERSGGVYALAVNEKYIAAAVDHGLALLDRKEGRLRIFDELDGLLSEKINAIVAEGDYLWLGSEEGITRFMWNNPLRVD